MFSPEVQHGELCKRTQPECKGCCLCWLKAAGPAIKPREKLLISTLKSVHHNLSNTKKIGKYFCNHNPLVLQPQSFGSRFNLDACCLIRGKWLTTPSRRKLHRCYKFHESILGDKMYAVQLLHQSQQVEASSAIQCVRAYLTGPPKTEMANKPLLRWFITLASTLASPVYTNPSR